MVVHLLTPHRIAHGLWLLSSVSNKPYILSILSYMHVIYENIHKRVFCYAWMQNTAGHGKSLTDPPRMHLRLAVDLTTVLPKVPNARTRNGGAPLLLPNHCGMSRTCSSSFMAAVHSSNLTRPLAASTRDTLRRGTSGGRG